MKKRFIVASASPRRKQLLETAGFEFEVIASQCDETLESEIGARQAVLTLSKRKAESVFEKNKDAVVLGCDTVVALENKILGKPKNDEEAFQMLRFLSGKVHTVYSGVCIVENGKEKSFVGSAEVEFFELSDEFIRSYVKSGEPKDKAGAYGIQGLGAALVKKINGDYFSIVGLPLAQSVRELEKFGVFGSLKSQSAS